MVPTHITIEDRDDRPQLMLRDPDRYFADARRRAEAEVRHSEAEKPRSARRLERP
jgi:hypothetical protein